MMSSNMTICSVCITMPCVLCGIVCGCVDVLVYWFTDYMEAPVAEELIVVEPLCCFVFNCHCMEPQMIDWNSDQQPETT